jgi:hypothetical protein
VGVTATREADRLAFERLCGSEPVLVDVRPAGDVVPGFTPDLILTSGAPLPWRAYTGGQREAILGAAQFEGLARDRDEAAALLERGEIRLGACHDHGCVGSVAGVYTASMPVFVVENRPFGNVGFCNFYEGNEHRRLNYGCYDDGVRDRLAFVHERVAPVVGEAVRAVGGVELKPLMRRALAMGDELHSRNTAATALLARALMPGLLDVAAADRTRVDPAVEMLATSDYFFLRLSMAAGKAIADGAHGIPGSGVVTALTISCAGFAIRVSGLGDAWFRGPHADVDAHLFEGHTADEITWMGGESCIAETIGLGGFAQAAAPALQRYQGGSAAAMIARNVAMYDICVGENTAFLIPALDYRGTPTGIDVRRVVATGIQPVIDAGIGGRDGGQIGAGVVRAPLECFAAAAAALEAAS